MRTAPHLHSLLSVPVPPSTVNPHARASLVRQVEDLQAKGLSLNSACAALGLSPASVGRWKQSMQANAGAVVDGRPSGRPARFVLNDTEEQALRGWVLRRGSLLLAIEDFASDPACSLEVADQIRQALDTAARNRKPVVIPPSLRRAGQVSAEEAAFYRGRKTFGQTEVIERRGLTWQDASGRVLPLAPNSIWESDDMSSNEPFRFVGADGQERVGRQSLFSIDVFSARWLGMDAIGRERDAYRVEDIADHMRELVDAWGLPMVWRLERGIWDSQWLHGIELEDGSLWGGLGELFSIEHTWKSRGKGTVESSFNLLQDLIAGGSETIGRTRGEFERGTTHYLRAQRGAADSLRRFWSQQEYAEAMAAACDRFNHRPKKRQAHGQAMVVPEELYAGATRRECPPDQAWRFCPVKKLATVRNGAVEVTETVHYRRVFRFRLNGTREGFFAPHGLRVAAAFHPGHPERGCHVFNADTSALNREAWSMGEPLVCAEYMPMVHQVNLSDEAGDFSGRKKANAHVRKEFRGIASAGQAMRRTSTARDGLGSALVMSTQRQAGEDILSAAGDQVRAGRAVESGPVIAGTGRRTSLRTEADEAAEIARLEAMLTD